MFPVGLMTAARVSTPVVASNGSVIDFNGSFRSGRRFIVDMAGFAVNVGFMREVQNGA